MEFRPHTDKLRELGSDVKAEVLLAKARSDLRVQEIEDRERKIALQHRWHLTNTLSRTGKELEEIKRLQVEQKLRESRRSTSAILAKAWTNIPLKKWKRSGSCSFYHLTI